MAVEVASHDLYNVSADVYSWAMVCYEIFTLQKPFAGWTREMHTNLVCGRGIRPEFPTTNTTQEQIAPAAVKQLLEISWHQNPTRRPNMKGAEHKMRQLEEQQLFKVCSLETKTNRSASQSFNAKHSQQSFTPMQIQIMRQQQQLQAQQYGNQSVVELPRDFDGRKAPTRNHSETFATSATTMSNVSTQSSDFNMHMNTNN
jgi:Protein tyrosine and serine/threonine kinase